ncbi:MAG TPA: hypothetical protein VFB16_14705 [Bauldia sp.]|nr:hypothetical protein [Bauldia sp.]
MTKGTAESAIGAMIGALSDLLERALAETREAITYIEGGNRNAAIGTIADLDQVLADALALQGAARAVHRQAR